MSSDVAAGQAADDSLLGSFAHLGDRLRSAMVAERGVYLVLAFAMFASAALILYLNRGTTFFVDEVFVFGESAELGPREVVEPVNGHLVATSRIYFKALLEVFGADYLAFRLLHVAVLMLAAALLFALARRRVGAAPALAVTIVLLFLGSAWQHVAIPIGTGVVFAIAAGLGALLALERRSRAGDIAACILVSVSVATFSVGLAFLVGVAVSVLLEENRRARAWIFLVPLLLYLAWWLVVVPDVSQPASEQTRAANALLIPAWTFDSLATVAGALTGLDYDFSRPGRPEPTPEFGYTLAVVAVAALVWRMVQSGVSRALWVALAIALSYWALGALAAGVLGREPSLAKFVYPGAVVTLLVGLEAARGLRLTRGGLIAMFAVAAVSVSTNLALLRDGAGFFRELYSGPVRSQLAMVELARGRVPQSFNPFREVPEGAPDSITLSAGRYLEAVDSFGSPAFSIAELEGRSEFERGIADQVLVNALGLGVRPADGPPVGECERLRRRAPGEAIEFELGPGDAVLRARGGGPVSVDLRRFADTTPVPVGELSPREYAVLSIPPDAASRPWTASVSGAGSLDLCGSASGKA